MNTVTYSGHTASEAGVSTWPSRKLTRRWDRLTKIETGIAFDGKSYRTKLLFSVGKTLRLTGTQFAPSSMRRFAEFLARAIAGAPATAEIDGRTRDIARWGGAETEARVRRMKGLAPSVAQWLEQARFHRARLALAKALKAANRALEQQPSHAEALELRFQLLEESGAGLKQLIAAAGQSALHAPEDASLRTRVHGLKLQANDARSVPDAEQLLAREPDNFVLGFALAGYFFRAKNFDRAIAITDALAKRPGAAGWQQGAGESRDYLQRYATSGTFRAKERLKYWVRIAAVLVPIILSASVAFWVRSARQSRPQEMPVESPQPEQEAEDRFAERVERRKKIQRDIEKKTGRLTGDTAEIKRRAEAGEAAAQYTLASRLLSGRELTEQNRAEGLRYLELAAAQDHLPAVLELAERLEKGRDLAADKARALVLLTKAVELGSARGAALLGSRYFYGDGVEKDEAKAFALYQKSAAGGYAWGWTMTAWSLEFGRGVKKDLPVAVENYRRAAEGKDRWAQERLARLLSDRKQPFHDAEEARKWAFAGARQGSEELRAQVLAGLIAGGPGTTAETHEALAWLAEDAAKDKAFALFYAGEAAWQGWYRPRNWTDAAKFYGRAAEKNYAPAPHLYARCLAAGVGVPQDLAKAREWRARAAEFKTPAPRLKTLDGLIAAMAWPLPGPPAEGEHRPQAILQERPAYPWRMAQAKLSGDVVVEFVIGRDGRTKDLRVVRSSHLEFELPALTAVAFWRFEPGVKNGRAVDVRVSQKVEFKLEEEPVPDVEAAR